MKVLLLIVSMFWFSNTIAQEYYKSFQYTTDDGLPSNAIYSITEDDKGNIVLGTDNGLTFFNGNNFKTFNVKEGLINPNIVAVTKDQNGTIWLLNYGGKLQKLEHNKIVNTPVFCEYYNQILNTKKSIFLYTTQAVFKSKRYVNIELIKDKGLKINEDTIVNTNKLVAPVLVQNDEEILFKNNYLLYKQYKVAVPKQVKLLHKVIFRKNDVCILDEYNLFIVDFKGTVLNTIKLPQALSEKRFCKYDFIIDQKENCWLNIQSKGLFILKNNRLVSLQNSLGLSIKENINFLYCDSKGRLWIATNQKGLFCIPNSFIEIIHFEKGENNFMGFAKSSNNESLYIATNFELYLYKNNQLNFLEKTELPLKIDNINNEPIYYFPYYKTLDTDKRLKSLQSIVGKQFLKKEGDKYFSLFGVSGIIICEKTNSDFKVHSITNKISVQEKLNKVVFHKNEYYFSNRQKINIRTFDDNYIYIKRELKLKFKGFIQDFTFIKDTMWIASNNVIYKVYNEKIVDSITHINGFELKNIQKINQIGQDTYLCAGNGLFKISKDGNRVLNKYNFLPNNEVNNVALFQNKLFVATKDGIGKINNEIVTNKSKRPILNVIFKGRRIDDVSIPTHEDSVELQLEIKNYYSIKNQLVEYKTDNTSWVLSNGVSITFPIQSYGIHSIKIRVKDINSDWVYKTIDINREFPLYLKWWFIVIVIFMLLFFLYMIYKNEITKLKRKQKQETATDNKIVELRQNALSALMNPHFLFNSLSSIQYFVNSNEIQKSSDYLGKLARLARLFLMQASSPFIYLEEEIKRLKLYIELEQIRFNNFKFNLFIDENIDMSKTKIPNMIIQPFIENAILHGISHLADQDGIITLNVFLENQLLTIEVNDNGFGVDQYINRNKNHISKGISIILERFEILQQSYPEKVFSIMQESVDPSKDRKGHKVTIKVTILP